MQAARAMNQTSALTAFLIFGSLAFSALGQLTLRNAAATPALQRALSGVSLDNALALATSPLLILGAAAYGASMILWVGVLSRMELSAAYPFAGLNFIVIYLFGVLILKEGFDPWRLAGTLLIASGVVLAARPQ